MTLGPQRICLITPGHLSSNPRIVKEADALSAAGHSVTVISSRFSQNADAADRAFAGRPWTSRRDAAFGPLASRPAYLWQSLSRHAARKALVAYPSPQNWRRSILIYRDGSEKGAKALDKSQRLDLYRLMRITKALADRGDYLEYADIAYQAGLPTEAIRMIAEGKAAGAVTATDGTAANILAGAQNSARQEGSLTTLEKQAATSANGKVASATGDAYFANGNFAKAVELYRLSLQKGGVDSSKVN